jgi:hypothetical protein
MFLQTIRGNRLEERDVIKNNRSLKEEEEGIVIIPLI